MEPTQSDPFMKLTSQYWNMDGIRYIVIKRTPESSFEEIMLQLTMFREKNRSEKDMCSHRCFWLWTKITHYQGIS